MPLARQGDDGNATHSVPLTRHAVSARVRLRDPYQGLTQIYFAEIAFRKRSTQVLIAGISGTLLYFDII
jgi:hypothetical protein